MPVLVLSEAHVRELLTHEACLAAMREALCSLAKGLAEQSATRPVLAPHGAAGLLGLMPAYAAGPDPLYGLKAVCLFPGNSKLGLDSHQGAVLLFSGTTGEALALLNASTITELRSPAVTAIATELLARPGAEELAVIGAGVQGRAHVRTLVRTCSFQRVRIVSRDLARTQTLCASLEKELELPVVPGSSVREAVENADVVVTATTSRQPILNRSWIRPGTHINAIGCAVAATREIDTATIAAATVFADSKEAVMAEAGDYIIAAAEHAIGPAHIRASLGDILVGSAPGRTSPAEITLFKSVGLAIEDLYAARHAYALAQQHGVGSWAEY
jgi:ornithine cyclodeaminase